MVKRFIYFIVFLVILLVGGALIAPSFIDWNQYKGQATAKIKESTGLDIALNGDIGFAIIPVPKLMVHDVALVGPKGAKNQNIATLKRFDVNVSLLPLLSGKIDVQSISLIEPVINIEIGEDGTPVFMTEEINALISPEEEEKEASSSPAMPEISFQNVTVKDAAVTYFDHKSGMEQKLQNINFELSAKTLTGPYTLSGHMFYEGKAINLDLEAGSLDLKEKVVSLKSKITVSPDDITLSYAGAVNFAQDIMIQGQLGFEAKAKSQFISKALKGQGLLTADKESIKITDMEVQSEGNISISGDVNYVFEGGKFLANVKSEAPVDGKALLGPSFPFETLAFDLAATGDTQKISFKDSSLSLDQSKINISGDYSTSQNGKAKLDLNVASDNLNLDKLAASGSSQEQQSSKQSLKSAAASLQLPFDLGMSFNSKKLKYGEFNLSNLVLDLSLNDNSLSIKEFAAYGLLGTYTTAKGSIGNIKNIAGLDLNTSVKIENIKDFKTALKLDQNTQADFLDKATINSDIKGSIDGLDLTSNIKSKGTEIYIKGKISDPFAQMSVSGLSLQVKHANTQRFLTDALGFADMGYDLSKPLDFYTDVSMNNEDYKFENIKASISSIPLSGQLLVQMKEKRPYVKGDFKAGLIKLVPKPVSGKSSTQSSSSDRWSKEPIDTSGFGAVDADITFSAQKIHKDLMVITQPSFSLALHDGTLDIRDFKGQIFDGSMSLSATVKTLPDEKRQPLHITAEGQFDTISLRPMIHTLIGRNFVNAEGSVSTSFDIKTSGLNQAAMIYDLAGNASLDGKEITVHNLDIKRFARALSDEGKAGDSVLGIWKGASSGGSTSFDTLDGKFTILEGVVNIDKLDLDGQQAYLQTAGKVNLPQWTLNTKHKITAKTEIEGEKEIPPFEISFSGSLDNPSQTFGQGLLQDYLKRKMDRKINKVLTDVIGGNSSNNPPPSPQNGQEVQEQEPASGNRSDDPEDLIKGVLEGLLR
ncbi:MAG: AsmA family protein [Alphaproteobacteria bacterium]|nr:AsmA family protein [Alphaproteobacteria bacterium]